MLARVLSLSVARLSTASFLIMLVAAATVLRRRRVRLFVVALAAREFTIVGLSVRRLIGRGTSASVSFGLRRRRRREEGERRVKVKDWKREKINEGELD
jgi:hypothetical protein